MSSAIEHWLPAAAEKRATAERAFENAARIEMATKLAALGLRMQLHYQLLSRHEVYLALESTRKYPHLYFVKRDHSAWCHAWLCAGQFRLEAAITKRDGNPHDVMCHHLTDTLDGAEDRLIDLFSRGHVVFGNFFLPDTLAPLDPSYPSPSPATREARS